MRSGKKIGVDVDEVMAVNAPAFVEFSNSNYGTTLTPDTYTEDWEKLWGVSSQVVLERARIYHTRSVPHFKKVKDSKKVLTRLSAAHSLVVVTARPSYIIDATHTWLDAGYENLFEETHFVPVWEPGSTATKAEICEQIGVDYVNR